VNSLLHPEISARLSLEQVQLHPWFIDFPSATQEQINKAFASKDKTVYKGRRG
jgi:hypothetical protein